MKTIFDNNFQFLHSLLYKLKATASRDVVSILKRMSLPWKQNHRRGVVDSRREIKFNDELSSRRARRRRVTIERSRLRLKDTSAESILSFAVDGNAHP